MPRKVTKSVKRKSKKQPYIHLYILFGVLFISALGILFLNSRERLDTRSQAQGELSQYLGRARGYLTTPQELVAIKEKAASGKEPYKSNVASVLNMAGSPTDWTFGSASGTVSCATRTDPGFIYLRDGGNKTYSKALAYHLTGNSAYADDVKKRLLDLTDTTGFDGEEYSGANACILELSWLIPAWIQSADLLEEYSDWTDSDKRQFQNWLKDEIYRKVAWSSRMRNNNWGAAGSSTSMMIADYLWDYKITLTEVKPSAKTLTPAQAYAEHRSMGLMRMNTQWVGDSQCTVHGIQYHGGIPDELRRGTTGCLGTYILNEDSSHAYMATHLEGLVYQAEILRRRGDNSFYNNSNSDGSGSIRQAILFVIANSVKSYDWVISKKATLHVAQRFYNDTEIQKRLDTNNGYTKSGYMLTYGKLTHGYAPGEVLAASPVVPPPSDELWVLPTPTSVPTATPIPTAIPPTATPIPTSTPTPTLKPTATPTPLIVAATPTPSVPKGDGLWGTYYNDTRFKNYSHSLLVWQVNFNWGTGSPHSRLDPNTFSARWVGYVVPDYTQAYTFYVRSDDGARLYIDGKRIIDNWRDQSYSEKSASVNLTAGKKHTIRVEYYENKGEAAIQLLWSAPSVAKQIVPQKNLYTK